MTNLDKITVRKSDVVYRACTPCGTVTAHLGRKNGAIGTTCLQCLVDGGNSAASFKEWNRWTKDGIGLTDPRGYKAPKSDV